MTHTVTVGDWHCTDRERELVNQVLDSGRLSYGPMSRALESRFAEIHDCDYAVLSNSGTSSLQVSLQALREIHGWQDGDEVIVPSVTFVATANIVLHNRMKPVLVDIDPDYYDMKPELIERAITPKTRAIIPVHLFGQPSKIEDIAAIAAANGLAIIEDSCETMFVRRKDRKVGSWGDVGNFSLYMAHLLTAGVGGITTTSIPDYAVKIRSLVNHGRDSIYLSLDDDDGLSLNKMREVIARRFSFVSAGHSFRVTELEAAIALAQLENWEGMIERRQQVAAAYHQRLERFSDRIQLPKVREGGEHAYMMFPLVYLDGDKTELVNHLESCGIETRDMLPLTNQPVYDGLFDPDDYPVAKWINESGFYIGSHQYLRPNDVDTVEGALEEFFDGN